jgi:hypothetical protein
MVRCEATTKRGRPCQRAAVPLSRFCRQHTTSGGVAGIKKRMKSFLVTIFDGGVTVTQQIQAISLDAAINAMHDQMTEAETEFPAEDRRTAWDVTISGDTAICWLHDGESKFGTSARVKIEAREGLL